MDEHRENLHKGLENIKKNKTGNSLVVQWLELSTFTAGGVGSIPGWGAGIPQASQPKNIKQKQYCNKFNKDF